MNGTSSDLDRDATSRSTDRPAVGIVATPGAGDAVAGAILRAHQRGYDPLVVPVANRTSEALQYARQFEAEIVSEGPDGSDGSPMPRLSEAARARGYPGLIFQEDPADRVDFTASSEALLDSEEYAIAAVPLPIVSGPPDVLVAIPAYGEAATISGVVSEARSHADEVIVIDDGSSDETARRAREAGAAVIEHERNRGYGAALKSAFREAERCGARHLVVLDGDGQHDPTDVPNLVAVQRETDANIVIGSRFVDGSRTELPLYRWVGLRVVNLLTNLSMGAVRPASRVTDTQSGFRAYDRRAIESLADDESIGDQMDASTDILHHAHRNDFRIEEVGTTVEYDVENANSRNPIAHGIQLVKNIVHTVEQERPISALGVPGFLSAFVGIAVGYLTVANYVNTGMFPVSLAFASTLFVLAGLFASFTAIVLHSLNQHLE